MAGGFGEAERAVLRAVCDTFVPAVEGVEDPTGFWGRRASDLGVDRAVEAYLSGQVPEATRSGLLMLLGMLGAQGFAGASQAEREGMLRAFAGASPAAEAGIGALRGLTLMLYYGLPDAQGRNPNWAVLGYPGPCGVRQPGPKPIQPLVPPAGGLEMEADVCVVGSGAGGGVAAAVLAQAGLSVVVIEAGGYYNEADFAGVELWAYQHLYYRGGATPTADGTVTLLAGATLGGGTVVNWMNCLRTRPDVRAEWAREHGLTGLDTAEFDRHLDAVWQRIGANDRCSDYNGPHQRLLEGCQRLGYDFKRITRNADPARYDADLAGYAGFGDPSGSKQSTQRTFLLDAHQRGARIVVRCRADRILVEAGRAAGLEATATGAEGQPVKVAVRAPRVVVAAGSLESPALLLRSGIGGPAVGQYLRLHPATVVFGSYDEEQRPWWGAPQSGLSDQFADLEDGYGYLIEGVAYAPGLMGAMLPWTAGRDHKERAAQMRNTSAFVAVARDRGHGRVTLDGSGDAVHTYPVADPLDQRTILRGLETQIRIHAAAGARQIHVLTERVPAWTRGDDLDAFVAQVRAVPIGPGGHRLFSAHQLGSCRMGRDPQTSVADGRGELHDTPGVWIGDGSAFPTASGTNPMVTIMALAHRTAEAIANARVTAGRPYVVRDT